MMTDPIANLLTVIRNATSHPDANKHRVVGVSSSKILVEIARIFKEEGYIEDFRVNKQEKSKPKLEILLKYTNNRAERINLKRISKPGLRVYAPSQKIPYVLSGLGTAIISTSQGLMTDRQARAKGAGGEVIAFVYRG